MQRPGHLVAATAAASETAPTNLPGLASSYAKIVRRRQPVEHGLEDQVIHYLRSQRLWKRYGGHQGALARLEEPGALPEVELQDIWLSDPTLPSATGAVTDDVIDELPQLASNLGLIRPHNFTRSERGRALVTLYQADLAKLSNGDVTANLLKLIVNDHDSDRLGAACYLLYCLVEADGDFLAASWATLLEHGADRFTRADFGSMLPAACRRLADQLSRSGSVADRLLVGRLDSLARHIAERTPATERTWGGGRPRDQVATLRLEPYVDFGLITRTSRTEYSYAVSTSQTRFFSELTKSALIGQFIDNRLVSAFLRSRRIEPQLIGSDEIWERIMTAYASVRSGLGYAPAREVVLLAIALLLDERTSHCFEVSDGLAVMRAQQKEHPAEIRYGVSPTGEPTYIRIGRQLGHD
jgi:hypothetical protein